MKKRYGSFLLYSLIPILFSSLALANSGDYSGGVAIGINAKI